MKPTMATIKSFIKKNDDKLFIQFRSSFDGMIDGLSFEKNPSFQKARASTKHLKNSLGIAGAWFVGRSRDYFSPYNEGGFIGYRVSNCCGCFVLAVKNNDL